MLSQHFEMCFYQMALQLPKHPLSRQPRWQWNPTLMSTNTVHSAFQCALQGMSYKVHLCRFAHTPHTKRSQLKPREEMSELGPLAATSFFEDNLETTWKNDIDTLRTSSHNLNEPSCAEWHATIQQEGCTCCSRHLSCEHKVHHIIVVTISMVSTCTCPQRGSSFHSQSTYWYERVDSSKLEFFNSTNTTAEGSDCNSFCNHCLL